MSKSPPNRAVLSVRVAPRGSRNAVEVLPDGSIKVWVTAPPVEGEANEAVCLVIAGALGVSKSSVSVTRGQKGKTKEIAIDGITVDEAKQRLMG